MESIHISNYLKSSLIFKSHSSRLPLKESDIVGQRKVSKMANAKTFHTWHFDK